ncbi:MAG: urease accessory protein UreD [Leptothrix ochracea]|uniref:urease accessory protein UreD n=1 Tax=Leptothrix ochracea TaxID=735331 RepID=UPI0034E1F22F
MTVQPPQPQPHDAASWLGHLQLRYWRDKGAGPLRTLAHDRHQGPLRVLQRLYPEGPGICHHVLVHPPGGVVGGDVLQLDLDLEADSHALITTPGATRFYRSAGKLARQGVVAKLAAGARLEWLPMESIAYSGCLARNHLRFELAPEAAMIGWDSVALGLPAAGAAFEDGCFEQHLELPGRWLERARIDAHDHTLLASPLGLVGQRVLGMIWFAQGHAWAKAQRESLLDAARDLLPTEVNAPVWAGATSPHEGIIVVRALANRVEPLMTLLTRIRAAWRQHAWGLNAEPPRIWRT